MDFGGRSSNVRDCGNSAGGSSTTPARSTDYEGCGRFLRGRPRPAPKRKDGGKGRGKGRALQAAAAAPSAGAAHPRPVVLKPRRRSPAELKPRKEPAELKLCRVGPPRIGRKTKVGPTAPNFGFKELELFQSFE